MNNFWKKHKIKVIILVYVAISFSLTRFVILPFVDKIRERSDNIQEKIIDKKIDEARIGKIPEMEAALKHYQDNEDSLGVILDPNDEVGFIKQLESMAEVTGNQIVLSVGGDKVVVTKKKTDDKKTIVDKLGYDSYIAMDVSLRGNYAGLVSFIKKLENASYYINIVSIKSTKITEEEEKVQNIVSSDDIFAAPLENVTSQPEKQKIKKDILSSLIKIIIYTKK